MRRFATILSVLVLTIMSAIVGVYPAAAEEIVPTWPDGPFAYTNTQTITKGTAFGVKGDLTTGKNIQSGEVAVIETTYTPADFDGDYFMRLYATDGGTGESYWEPVKFKADGDIIVNNSAYGTTNKVTVGKATLGENYSIVAVIAANGANNTYGCVYINGQKVSSSPYLCNNPSTRPYHYIYGLPNSTTTITKLSGITDIDDFNYNDYKAQITSTEPGVSITGDKDGKSKLYSSFGITVIKPQDVTAGTLKDYLIKPDGATVEVYQADGTTLIGDNKNIWTGCIVKSTSKNKKTVLSYKINFSFAWPDEPFIYVNTGGSNITKKFGIPGDLTTNNNIQSGDFVLIETIYKPLDFAGDYYLRLYGSDGGTGESYWDPVTFKKNGDIVVNHSAYGESSAKVTVGKAVIGETYHIVAVIYANGTRTYGCVFINGQEVSVGQYLQNNPATRPYCSITTLPRSTTTITKLAGITDIESFDFSRYEAQVTTEQPNVIIEGHKDSQKKMYSNFEIILTGGEIVTASQFEGYMQKPAGATLRVLDPKGNEMEYSNVVTTGCVLESTSENEFICLKYNISVRLADDIDFITDESGTVTASVYEGKRGGGTFFLASYKKVDGKQKLNAIDMGIREQDSSIIKAKLNIVEVADKEVVAFYWGTTFNPISKKVYIAPNDITMICSNYVRTLD